MTEEVTAV